jgi:hypothetical protein
MEILLWAFSAFNLVAAVASLGHGLRLIGSEEQAAWRSRVLLWMAVVLSWTLPLAAGVATVIAWQHHLAGQADAVPIVLIPLMWLVLMGTVFAIVDFAEDGIMGNARTPQMKGAVKTPRTD